MEVSIKDKVNITEYQQQELFEKIRKIIDKWIIGSNLSDVDRARLCWVVYSFHCLAPTDLHKEWKVFRAPYIEEKKKKQDIEKLEKVKRWIESPVLESSYSENVILRDVYVDTLHWLDNLIVIAKEFGTYWENNERKFCYTNEEFIFESEYPITYLRCKMNLHKKNSW